MYNQNIGLSKRLDKLGLFNKKNYCKFLVYFNET